MKKSSKINIFINTGGVAEHNGSKGPSLEGSLRNHIATNENFKEISSSSLEKQKSFINVHGVTIPIAKAEKMDEDIIFNQTFQN